MMPTSEPVLREQLSAWQRWELASLTDAAPAAVKPQTPVEIHALARAEAMQAGFAAGHAEGRIAAEAERAQLQRLLVKLAAAAIEHEQRMADDLLDLALVLARQMVGEALAVRRELVLPIVSAALRQLPQATQRVEVVLHPGDVELVRSFLDKEPLGDRCTLIANSAVAPGGCRMETEQCEIDATTASRWKRLLAAMGRTDDWLEPI